jgi:hypothetical protein
MTGRARFEYKNDHGSPETFQLQPPHHENQHYSSAHSLLSGALLSSCATTPPLSQMLPPASKPRLEVLPDKLVQKDHGISYTIAGLQAGNMYGVGSMLIGGVMRSVTLSHNAAFSSKWKQSGKNAPNIILDEYRREFARNGYTQDDTAPDKLPP